MNLGFRDRVTAQSSISHLVGLASILVQFVWNWGVLWESFLRSSASPFSVIPKILHIHLRRTTAFIGRKS